MGIPAKILQDAYLEACELELQAFKPGNVSVYSPAHDMTVEDFRRSAKASAPPLCDPKLSLGEKIYRAIEATHQVVDCNTNLGIVLLAAPMMEACLAEKPAAPLRELLSPVLERTTREDADWVYRAIRLASPAGLGSSEQDVHSAPEVTLCEAMAIAANRDRIAWQFSNSFSTVLDFAIPRYHSWLNLWGDEKWAVLGVFAELLQAFPDSHIERKFGTRHNQALSDRMARVEAAMKVPGDASNVLGMLREIDAEFKSARINPGTTADLTVACLLAVRLDNLLAVDLTSGQPEKALCQD